jgi:hypothetical protein
MNEMLQVLMAMHTYLKAEGGDANAVSRVKKLLKAGFQPLLAKRYITGIL